MSDKKLLILGASGVTGQHLVQQALERNHSVTALVRDPAKISTTHDRLSVEKCDIFDKTQLQPQIDKTDVVLSCLGFPLTRGGPVPYFLDVARNVSECMQAAGKRRTIFMHSWYTNPASHSKCKGFFLRNVFIKYIIGSNLAGMRLSEEFLETQDHLDFTTIHPAHLLNGPVTEKVFTVNDEEHCVPDCKQDINRSDVARYMLDVIDDEGSFRKFRAIGVDGPKE